MLVFPTLIAICRARDRVNSWVVLVVALFLTWQVRENSARQFDRMEQLVRESVSALRSLAQTRQEAPAEVREEGIHIEPFLRTRDPQGGEELLTAVLVQPTVGSPYSSLWVSASLHITNDTDEMHEFICQRMTLHWGDERIDLEYNAKDLSARIINILTPIGKGQRGLIVSPPMAGKTTLLKQIANGLNANHPDINNLVSSLA